MSIFHKHNGVLIEETYAPPVQEGNVQSRDEGEEYFKALTKMTMGVTTRLYQCKECTKLKTIEMLGDIRG